MKHLFQRRSTVLLLLVALPILWWPTANALADLADQVTDDAADSQQPVDGYAYTVQPGDSLYRIAEKTLGAQTRWRDILEATNEQAVSGNRQVTAITDPRLIFLGQVLWIPGAPLMVTDTPTLTPISTPTPPDTLTPTATPTSTSPKASYSCSSGLAENDVELLYPSRDQNGLMGYIDDEGEFAIAGQFQIATRFSEGLAVVSQDGKGFFYINSEGERAFPPKEFSDAGPFMEGRAAIRSSNHIIYHDDGLYFPLSGFIDCQGNPAIAPTYLSVEPFRDGVAQVVDRLQNIYYVDRDGRTVVDVTLPHTEQIRIPRAKITVLGNEQEGKCTNESAYGDHLTLYRCTLDEESATTRIYDPCVLAGDNISIVCGFPDTSFVVAKTLYRLETIWDQGPVIVEDLWLRVASSSAENDPITCQRLVPPVEIDFAEIDNEEIVQPTLNYECSDETYILGEPEDDLLYEDLLVVTKVRVERESEEETEAVWVDAYESVPVVETLRLSTELIDPSGGPGQALPPAFSQRSYWRMAY